MMSKTIFLVHYILGKVERTREQFVIQPWWLSGLRKLVTYAAEQNKTCFDSKLSENPNIYLTHTKPPKNVNINL